MSETREFTTAAVLSCTTDILLGPDIGCVYEVLNFVLQDDLMTHQLPNAATVARPHLIRLHPWLAEAVPPQGDLDALMLWLGGVEREHGTMLELAPVDLPAWVRRNGLADLADMLQGRDVPVIPVVIPEDPS
jgi:hypothetical protein